MAGAERWAAALPLPGYAIDDQTAIRVTNDNIDVISEGTGSCSGPDTDQSWDPRPMPCAVSEPPRHRRL
jgi:hypothetical protein